jgi:DNA invertase Pin-like site-specific DNA recombinase
MIFGYVRTPSPSHPVDTQLTLLREAGATTITHEVTTAPWDERPELSTLIAGLAPGDVVLVAKVVHLTRLPADLLRLVAVLSEKGAGFRALDAEGIDTTTAEGVRLLTSMIVFSEEARANAPEREFADVEPMA